MNPALSTSSRISRLKKRFLDILSGSVRLDSRGATLFLQGLCAQDDPVVCLNAIIESAHGLPSVQAAMQFDLSVQFMNGLGSSVLEYLLRASDAGGDALDNLLFHVVEPPIFWGVFVHTFQQGALSEDAQLVFARVLSRLITLQERDTSSYRDIAARPSIQNDLLASSKREVREMGHLIKHIMSTTNSLTVNNVLNGPGGRHDNDFPDYRDIAILPTADEILCRKPPFLRTAFHDELDSSEAPVKDYLDNTFRMFREDMIFDIREEVQAALQKDGKHRGLRVDRVSMVGLYTGANDRKTRWGIKLQCASDLRQLKGIKERDARVKFLKWDPRGSKMLRSQSLVCLASGQDIISFGTVNRVEELLACNPPVIVVQLDGDVNIRNAITSLCAAQSVQLIQIDTATFSFEPVLSALKTCNVPLSKEILLWKPDSPIESSHRVALSHLTNALISNPSVELDSMLDLPKSVRLDKSQAKSLVAGLQQRVSLIQGPPGTGKSFIGVLLAKAIHDETIHTILVVCYTNHALDQFLGDLLEYDIPAESIVRLGGRSNESTDHLSLHRQPRGRFRYDWDKINELKRNASNHENRLQTHFDTLLDINNQNMIRYLELKHHEFFEAFHVPSATEDGMTRVGRNGQAIDEGYLFSRWIRGQNAGVLRGERHVQASARIWSMARPARQQLLKKWRHELVNEELESICSAGRSYNKLQDTIKQEFSKSTVSILQRKRIIACTTTGAAIYAEALEQVGPEVLLVEEAGEILESHTLTALSSTVNQMILIGDHKQLRPKVNNYQLTVERGEGFDLNRSLFERLVLKGYPHETLSTQHRMRPEISAFVRELTYPELIDAPSTYHRSDIHGVQSNIIFVDHTHPEDEDSLIGDRTDGGAKASKRNTYEVQMVLKIVHYLGQQGYKSEDIVVLTPYLGQLHYLRNALKGDNDLIINDLDSSDLARAGLSISESSDLTAKTGRIRLATIDNYQGEESNIVVASLTRSNQSNTIGFMDSPERLNVLLSRARDGLILIGNSQTFLHSRKGGALWTRFLTLLEHGGYVYRGFPVKCERHPEHMVLLTRAGDFDAHCPDGGCTELCGFTLDCGHTCTMKCHPRRSAALTDPHDTSQCKFNMSAKCPAGHHKLTWECRRGQPRVCSVCVKEAERLEEITRQEHEVRKRREEAEAEHRRQMAELEAEKAAEEQRRLQAEHEARLREEWRQEEERRKIQEEVRLREERRRQEEAQRTRQEEARLLAERRRQEEERRRVQEEVRLREERRRQEEERRRIQEEMRLREERRQEEERRKKQEEARLREERRQEEERRKRLEEANKLEEERKRLQDQEIFRGLQQVAWAGEREAESPQEQQLAAAKRRRETLIAERKREDARAVAIARAREYIAERENHQETLGKVEQSWAEEREAERQREDARAAAVARAKEYVGERGNVQETLRRVEQSWAEGQEAERLRQEQQFAAKIRSERLIAGRQREDTRAAAISRAKEYVAGRESHQETLKRAEQSWAEERQLAQAAAERQARLIAERRREDARAAAEREREARDSAESRSGCTIG